jgi:hypothetical protein
VFIAASRSAVAGVLAENLLALYVLRTLTAKGYQHVVDDSAIEGQKNAVI